MMAQIADARKALVLYGSETGNAQDIAEELGRICERLRFATSVCELDSIDIVCSVKLCTCLPSMSSRPPFDIEGRKSILTVGRGTCHDIKLYFL